MDKQNKAGRPTVITAEIVSLLVTAFHNGLTVREACWQSGISHETYYNRLRSDEQFADTMARAQSDLVITAKSLMAKELRSGSVAAAKWWLEHSSFNTTDNEQLSKAQPDPVLDQEKAQKAIDALVQLEIMRRERGYTKRKRQKTIDI